MAFKTSYYSCSSQPSINKSCSSSNTTSSTAVVLGSCTIGAVLVVLNFVHNTAKFTSTNNCNTINLVNKFSTLKQPVLLNQYVVLLNLVLVL